MDIRQGEFYGMRSDQKKLRSLIERRVKELKAVRGLGTQAMGTK